MTDIEELRGAAFEAATVARQAIASAEAEREEHQRLMIQACEVIKEAQGAAAWEELAAIDLMVVVATQFELAIEHIEAGEINYALETMRGIAAGIRERLVGKCRH